MRAFTFLIASCAVVFGAISYPVDVQNDRFSFILGEEELRGRQWPREDGQALVNPEPGLVVMQEVYAADPEYDPATHKLDAGSYDDDPENESTTFSREAVPLTQEELDAIAAAIARAQKWETAQQAVADLRQWATDAENTTVNILNANSVLQDVNDRFGILCSNLADVIEAANPE